jgi:hypothetical protein
MGAYLRHGTHSPGEQWAAPRSATAGAGRERRGRVGQRRPSTSPPDRAETVRRMEAAARAAPEVIPAVDGGMTGHQDGCRALSLIARETDGTRCRCRWT